MTRTETIATEYGETNIEVVDCDSCGNTTSKEHAVRFKIGNRKGWACQHCEENGPISFPRKVVEFVQPIDTEGKSSDAGLYFFTFMYVLALPVWTMTGITKDDKFAQGYATAVITTAIWVVVIALVIYLA